MNFRATASAAILAVMGAMFATVPASAAATAPAVRLSGSNSTASAASGAVIPVSESSADTTVPVLDSFSVSGSPATPGSTITVSYAATEASGSLQMMLFDYSDSLGGTHQVRTDGSVPLTGTITQIIPATWPNGTYTLTSISVSDPTGNEATYMAGGTIYKEPSGATGPTSHTFNLNNANFTVTGSSADTTVPVLDSFSVSGSPATPGSTITVSYAATEASGSLQMMLFDYSDSLGGTHQVRTDGSVPLTGTITQIIPATWPNGTYTLTSISVSDPTGNEATYMAGGTIYKEPSGATGPTSHTFNLNNANFTVAQVPSPPLWVSISGGNQKTDLVWSPASGNGLPITGYTVTASPGGRTVTTTGATEAAITGLTNGSAYTFTVTATNALGTSQASAVSDAVTPSVTLPGQPSAVSANPGDESAVVSWSAPNDGGSAITAYTVTSAPGGRTVTTTGTTTTTVTGLSNGTAYTFAVTATNAVGTSLASEPSAAVVPATAPSAPRAVTAAARTNAAQVSWTEPEQSGGVPVTGYAVTSSPGGKTAMVSWLATTASVGGLSNGVAYTFTVTATNNVGASPASAPSNAVTPAVDTTGPRLVGVDMTPGSIDPVNGPTQVTITLHITDDLSGLASSDPVVIFDRADSSQTFGFGRLSRVSGDAFDGIYRGTVSVPAGTAPGNWDLTLYPMDDVAGNSAYSFDTIATLKVGYPGAPTAVGATPVAGGLRVSWAAPASDGGNVITGYTVTTSPGGQSVSVPGSNLETVIKGLQPGSPYTFTVTSTNAAGQGPSSSASQPVLAPATTPNAPTGVTAAAGDAQAVVSWTAPASDGGSPITGYTVTANPSGKTATTTGATTATVTGLTNGTASTFTVTATNTVGTSPASAASAAITPKAPATAPGTPTSVTATAGDAQAAVTWTAPAINGGSAITGYTVTATPGGRTATTTGATTATVTGLTNDTGYKFTVSATNTVGTSEASAASAAVTPATVRASVIRFAGTDRFATSAAIAHANYLPGVPVVYIATGLNFPDALAGGAAAAKSGGPLLLVQPEMIPTEIAAELTRLRPAKIVVLGGTAAVSDVVLATLKDYTAGPVTRVAGANRYATAANLAATFPVGSPVFLATGTDFPDALAGTAAAADRHAAILLTSPTTLPSDTAAALFRLNPSSITILGGTAAVSTEIANMLKTYTSSVSRMSGPDRYATAAAIATNVFPHAAGVFITTGAGFADALTGGPVAGASGQPLLLATATCLPAPTAAVLAGDTPATITLLGGTSALGAGVASLTTCTP